MKRIVIPIATFNNGSWVLNIKLIDELYCYAVINGFTVGSTELDPTLCKEKRQEELAVMFEGMKHMVLKVNKKPLNQGVPEIEITYSKFIKTDEPVMTEMKEIKKWIKDNGVVTAK